MELSFPGTKDHGTKVPVTIFQSSLILFSVRRTDRSNANLLLSVRVNG